MISIKCLFFTISLYVIKRLNYIVVKGLDGLDEIENMNEMSVEQGDTIRSETKTHEEILVIIKEIKGLEEKFMSGDFFKDYQIEFLEVEDEFIEIEHPPIEQREHIIFEEVTVEDEVETELEEKIIYPAVFRIRFNEEGKLENLDLKKAKPKPHLKSDLKKLKVLKKIKIIGRKGESRIEKVRLSKIKDTIGKISKIRNVIPGIGKKEEEPVKEETEEGETEEL